MNNPHVLLETSAGDILLELDPDKAPLTVKNFLDHVDGNFYQNTLFHRVIKGFMIQGGGLSLRMEEKTPLASVRNEADNGLRNTRGALAMARSSDPHSAASQFFINVADNPELDFSAKTETGYGYCVFGALADGLDVADKIAGSKVRALGGHEHAPVDSVIIIQMSRFEF
jgi:peptidyl-prolyl cis-trans isomerase B (cyclophilin B)